MADIQFVISAIDNFSSTFDKLDSVQKQAAGVAKAVGAGMMAVGTSTAAGLGMAIKTTADFEKAMSRVGALSGATDSELAKLTKTAEQLGATTVFSASEAAEGMSYLAMAGYDTNEIIAAMPGLLNAAAAGQIDLASTADITSNILSGFGLQASETARVADVLTKTFTSSNTNLSMLGETMKYLAPTANALGMELEEMSAAVGLLGNAGIQGSMAGTSLAMSLTRLASPTKEAAEIMQELGFNAFDANGKMLPLHEIIGRLTKATSKLTDEQKLHAISTIFGAESMKAILTLMEAGEDTLVDFTKELRNAGGTAEEIANKQLDNLMGQLEELQGALETAAISIGNALLPVIKFMVRVIQGAVEWFNNLTEGEKRFVAFALAISSVMAIAGGALLVFIGFLPALVEGLKTVAAIFGVSAGTMMTYAGVVFGVIAAVIALGIAIYMLYKRSDTFKAYFGKAMNAVKAAGAATFGFLKQAAQAVSEVFRTDVIPALQAFWSKASEVFGKVLGVVAPIVDTVVNKVKNFGTDLQNAFTKAMNLDFSGIAEVAAKFIPSLIGLLLGGIPRLIIVGTNLISAIADGMGLTVPELMDKVVEFVTGMIDAFLANLPLFLDAGIQVIVGILDGILSQIPTILNVITQLVTSFTETLTDALPLFIEAGIQILTALISGIGTALPQILTTAIKVITTLIGAIVAALPQILLAGIQVLMALINGIVQMLPLVIETGITLLMSLIQGIISVLPLLIESAITLIMAIVTTLIEALPAIIEAGIQILFALVEGIIQMLPILIDAAITLLFAIVDTLIQNLPAILTAGIKLVMALIDGLIQMIPMLIGAAITLVITLIKEILNHLDDIFAAGVELVLALVDGLLSIIGEVISAALKIGRAILDEISSIDLFDIGKDIIRGLINGIGSMVGSVAAKVKEIGGAISGGISKVLDIHSPSKVMMQMGEWTGEGMAIGLSNMVETVRKSAEIMGAAAIPNMSEVKAPNMAAVRSYRSGGIYPAAAYDYKPTPATATDAQPVEYFFEIPVVIDGREVGRATARFTDEELRRMKLNKTRARGAVK